MVARRPVKLFSYSRLSYSDDDDCGGSGDGGGDGEAADAEAIDKGTSKRMAKFRHA